MNLVILWWTVLSTLVLPATSQKLGVSSPLGYGCWQCAQKWNFGCSNKYPDVRAVVVSINNCQCKNLNFMGTVLACISKHGQNEAEMDKAHTFVQHYCHYNGHKLYTKREINDMYKTAANLLINSGNVTSLDRVYAPVEVDKPDFSSQFKAASMAKKQYWFGSVLGFALLGYWGAVMVGAGILNALKHFAPKFLANYMTPRFVDSIRRHLVLPALFKGSHSRPVKVMKLFPITAPTRGQAMVVFGYLAGLVAVCGTVFVQESRGEWVRYMGNRTGIVAFTQLPLLLLFACRNNPLIFLTGWPYSTFQIYHHWMGRMVVLLGLIHGVCFTRLASVSGSTDFRWKNISNWQFGNVALFVSILMIAFAYSKVRKLCFELFVFLHKSLFIVFMIGLYKHCYDFGWMYWFYLTAAIFVGDRIVRWIKMGISGIATAKFDKVDPMSIKVIVQYSKRWKPRAGAFIYLRIWKRGMFWQAHPFSVFQAGDGESLELIIRSKGGATAQYLAMAERGESATVTIEGPYGTSLPLHNYQTVVLFAGGVGITSMYSHALSLVNNGTKVVLVWAIPDRAPMTWFRQEMARLTENDNIKIEVYVSRMAVEELSEMSDSCDSDLEEETIAGSDSSRFIPSVSSFDSITKEKQYMYLFHERPKVSAETARFVTTAVGRAAICSCGPPKFLDEIRRSITTHLHETESRVDYFEESFSW